MDLLVRLEPGGFSFISPGSFYSFTFILTWYSVFSLPSTLLSLFSETVIIILIFLMRKQKLKYVVICLPKSVYQWSAIYLLGAVPGKQLVYVGTPGQ